MSESYSFYAKAEPVERNIREYYLMIVSGTVNAVSYCNIHGLWKSNKKIVME
jgi:desulfoferrodoxin (superoxide reductase-like protein)